MTLADELIAGNVPDLNVYLQQGESLDDMDEYGFTPLIETAIVDNYKAAELLLTHGISIDKPDATGRTALHWAVDNHNLPLVKLLLDRGASPNAYNRGGQSALVFPILRDQWQLKQLLYQHDASLDFALDFINTKLIGHRFELSGDVDIVNAAGEFIELDFEGFFLEFTIAMIRDSLSRFRNNFAARHLRPYFGAVCEIIYGFEVAEQLLKYQYLRLDSMELEKRLATFINQPILIFPVACRGHALAFVRYDNFWAKIDRGENSLKEGTVNIYMMEKPDALSVSFIRRLLYQKLTPRFIHHEVNKILGLKPCLSLPLSPQITGNCSWANIEGVVPTSFVMHQLRTDAMDEAYLDEIGKNTLAFYEAWSTWDKDRALDECIGGFSDVSAGRKASKVSILASVLFQSCDYGVSHHMERAEKILKILTLPEYSYVLDSYLQAYCVKRLTPRGNNLLKILEDNGIDPRIGVSEVASPRKKPKRRSRT